MKCRLLTLLPRQETQGKSKPEVHMTVDTHTGKRGQCTKKNKTCCGHARCCGVLCCALLRATALRTRAPAKVLAVTHVSGRCESAHQAAGNLRWLLCLLRLVLWTKSQIQLGSRNTHFKHRSDEAEKAFHLDQQK